jgi:hypothetical protein
MILSREILNAATGGGIRSVEENPGSCYGSQNLFAVVYRDKYLYRANCRMADIWEFKNIQATAAPKGAAGGSSQTSGGGGTNSTAISTTTIQNLQQTLFSFQNLLNIFKRIYAK